MLKKTIIFAAFVGFAFTVNTPAPANAPIPAYAGAKCSNHKHTGTGRGASKKTAKWAARQKWRYGVLKHKHHPFQALWSRSVEQSSSCRRKYGVYKCRVQAYPCKKFPTRYDTVIKGISSPGFTKWCKKKYRNVRRAKLIGKTAGDWVCLMKNGSRRPISVKGACILKHGAGQVFKAAASSWSNPYSWRCFIHSLV